MEHLHEYLDLVRDKLPTSAERGPRRDPAAAVHAARPSPGQHRLSATDFAKRFIAGENVPQVLAAAKRERAIGRGLYARHFGRGGHQRSRGRAVFPSLSRALEVHRSGSESLARRSA